MRFAGGPRITVIQGKMRVGQDKDPQSPLELRHRVLDTGEAAVEIAGELDLATADAAFEYVKKIIDDLAGPVVVGLAEVTFCDARGLHALVRMSHYADKAGCPFRVTSPSPRLASLMRITGLDETFLAAS
jgi:anti-sigma B factor antagonist